MLTSNIPYDSQKINLSIKDTSFTVYLNRDEWCIKRSGNNLVINLKEIEEFDPSVSIVEYVGKIKYFLARELMDHYSLYKLAAEKCKKLSLFL